MQMRFYETVFVLKPTLTEEEINSNVESFQEFISNNDGEVYNLEKWGRKELAYPILNFKSGYYFLINFKTENNKLPTLLENQMRLNENVIRFLTFNIKPPKEKVEEQPSTEESSETQGE
jgi:small subunit ribosomal protein S6